MISKISSAFAVVLVVAELEFCSHIAMIKYWTYEINWERNLTSEDASS